MVDTAFLSIDNYLETFHEIAEIHKIQEDSCKAMIAELEAKYSELLSPKTKRPDEFLIPEIPRVKKEIKRESRASKRNTSVVNRTISLNQTSSSTDNETFRRSSRIASKTKTTSLLPNALNPIKPENISNNTYILSPSHQPCNKIRRTDDLEPKKSEKQNSPLEESICTANMKQPLGASTPTSPFTVDSPDGPEMVKNERNSMLSDKENTTPVSNGKSATKGESVKKRIEEFEKRAKGNLNPTKLPVKSISSANLKKTDERNRKAAAQREASEKEKMVAVMKLEKEKDEKFKQIQKQKEEKLREERLKKRQMAAMKAAKMEERRKQEDAARLAKLKKAQIVNAQIAKSEIPQYEISNIEGDSSEDEDNPKKQIPSWATKKMREYPLNVQAWLNRKETVYPWFYNKNLKYPKLEELFSKEVKTRPRTSSAVWNSKIYFNESFPIM